MRVIGGLYRGRRLLSPPRGKEIRPTSDRAKEALFNILQTKIIGYDFLDLFAGTGNVGIEALSRGARVVFVDGDPVSAGLIQDNLKLLSANARVVKSDALTYIETSAKDAFDYIFIDPPYNPEGRRELLSAVFESGVLREGGLVISENAASYALPESDGYEIADIRKYGVNCLTFVKAKK
ncbi:MAG: 16S rRNA (guanine(966)-N(2))-methyltransferase RsmD [Clostridiales bacterium]|jgi:16S rRNA (guanine(966)-N(2))-methyltransferase RsmD|nr:16S rRNA (guanine(966)-N(2))-methyltransferase RsmD [Clostridiales bacterium]